MNAATDSILAGDLHVAIARFTVDGEGVEESGAPEGFETLLAAV
jgi:hypothetical protein